MPTKLSATIAWLAVIACDPGSDAPPRTVEPETDARAGQKQHANAHTWWELPQDGLWNVDGAIGVEQFPGDASKYFWGWFYNFDNGDGTYIGLQTTGGPRMAIFSIWNAVGADGPGCATFGGEGDGWSCRIGFNFEPGHLYRTRIRHLWGDWWGGSIIDANTLQEHYIGSIRTRSGISGIQGWADAFTEYYGDDVPCSDIGIAGAWFERPLANGESLAGTAVSHDVGPACFGIANNPSEGWSWHRYGCPSADCG